MKITRPSDFINKKGMQAMTQKQWSKEYKSLDDLYHKLEEAGLHSNAERVADRLKEMERVESMEID